MQKPAAATLKHPPLPPARLRIGVTGHRPGSKLDAACVDAVSSQVTKILEAIASESRRVCRDGCAGRTLGAPELVVISPLAAGADQLVARAALAQQWHLESVLPFARDDYANDLSGADLAEFRALLDASSSVLELDGKRAGAEASNRAYEAAGLVTLANSDIVIAIWDQKPAEGRGGTALIVNSAIEEGIPVVLLDPAGRPEPEHQPKLIWTGFIDLPPGRPRIEEMERRDAQSEMKHVVESLILPPPAQDERDKLRAYLAETQRRVVPHFAYPVLQWVFAGRRPGWGDWWHPEYVAATTKEWQPYLGDLPALGGLAGSISRTLLPSYAFADRLAVVYAQLYRTAFTFNYLAAWVAVTLALIGVFHGQEGDSPLIAGIEKKTLLVGFEFALMLVISWRTFRAHRSQRHRRWMEYRRLAEDLRHLRMLAPVAGASRFPRPPLLDHNKSSWISWLLMVNARALPLPHAVIDETYLRKLAGAVVANELEGTQGQIRYNSTTAERMHKMDTRLHILGLICFLATALVCVGYLVSQHMLLAKTVAKDWKDWTTFLTALLPALGAALSAIRVQGDFESLSTRAKQTLRQLRHIVDAIKRQAAPDTPPPLTLARLADQVDKAAEAMSSDLDEWQILSKTKSVPLPV